MGWKLKSGDGPEFLSDGDMAKLDAPLAPAAKPAGKPQPKSFTASDEELGISSPLAEETGEKTVFPGGHSTHDLGRTRAHVTTELEGDPLLQTLVAGSMGAALGAGAAGLTSAIAPAAAPLIGGMTAGGSATAAQGGDTRDVLMGALLGGAPGAASSVRALARQAPEAVAARLPTEITGGGRTKAAKAVVGSDLLPDTLDAHPELKKTLSTPGDPGAKAKAVTAKLAELTDENDAVTEAIAKHHGKISTDVPLARLQKLAETAEEAGDEVTRDAVTKTIESIDGFSKGGGTITAQQLRGIRNGLASKIQQAAPGSAAFSKQGQAALAVKAAVNDAIADLAEKTPGVDVAALKARNGQIASLIPVQTTLEEQAAKLKLDKGGEPLTDALRAPMHKLANAIDTIPAHADLAMAGPTAQRLFGRLPGQGAPGRVLTAPGAAGAARASSDTDISYAAKVAEAMKGGMSLQDAVEAASQ